MCCTGVLLGSMSIYKKTKGQLTNRKQFQRTLGGAPDDDFLDSFLPSTNYNSDPADSLISSPDTPQFQKIPDPQPVPLQPINRQPQISTPPNPPIGTQASNTPTKTIGQRVIDLEDKYDNHKKWGDFFRTLTALTALLLLALIAAYIVTTVLTSTGDIGPGDNNCIDCAANGTLIVKHDLQVDGHTYFYGNVTSYANFTANQISLLNTTSDIYFDLFNFLNNLVVSALPCAYCAPNGTFITEGNVIVGGNGTLTVNYIELLNTTTMTYFDLFTFLNDLDMLLRNVTIQHCTIIQVCGPSGNLTAAIASAVALSPSDTNSVGIEFCPGTYVINNSGGPVTIPHFVSLQARAAGSVSLTPSTPGNAMFALSGQNNVYGFDFYNGQAGAYLRQTAFVDGGVTVISDCTMRDGGTFYSSAASGGSQERVIIRNSNLVANNGVTTNIVSFLHAGSAIVENTVFQHAPGGFGMAIVASGTQCVYTITGCSIIGLSSGIFAANIQYSLTVSDLYVSDITYAVINIPTVAAGLTELYFDGIVVDYSYGFVARMFNIDTSEEFIYQFGDVQHYNCTEEPKPSTVSAVYIDVSAFEPAVERVLIDESIGVPEKPQSSFVGSGKNSLRQLLLYTYNGASYTDVQTNLCAGNTFTMTGTVNSALYAAVNLIDPHTSEPFQHYGLMFEITTAAAGGAGGFVVEYWDGAAWTGLNFMVYNSDYPYIPNTGTTPLQTVTPTTINYDWRIKTGYVRDGVAVDPWVANDDPGVGVDLFWVRFRIISGTITTPPVVSFVQYTTNTMETNSYGVTLYHGFARRMAEVDVNIALFQPKITTPSTGEFTITFSGGQTSEFANAQFNNGVDTSRGFNFIIPCDCDTSSAIVITLTYRTTTASNTNMAWNIAYVVTENSYLYATVVPTSYAVVQAVTAATVNQQQQARFLMYATNSQIYDTSNPGRTIGWFFFEREGTSGSDTYAGVMQLVSLTAHYTKRMEGMPLLY